MDTGDSVSVIIPSRLEGSRLLGAYLEYVRLVRIDGLMDAVDPDDALDVKRTVAEMRR